MLQHVFDRCYPCQLQPRVARVIATMIAPLIAQILAGMITVATNGGKKIGIKVALWQWGSIGFAESWMEMARLNELNLRPTRC